MAAEEPDLSSISPEEFARMVAAATDEQIVHAVHAGGTEPTLNRVFEGMQSRFVPDRAVGVDAEIQFAIHDDGNEYAHLVSIHDGTCSVAPATVEDPKVTLATDLVSFLKMVAGKVGGPQLFMTGKLKISGDLFFATRIMGFFDTVGA
jgi:putative sterol carrier protein